MVTSKNKDDTYLLSYHEIQNELAAHVFLSSAEVEGYSD